jgi:broad specificity phosphatase PhoE
MTALYLVRHGRPDVDRRSAPHLWELHPSAVAQVAALRPRLPEQARWFSSPEPKAVTTARLLTDAPVRIVPALREQERHTTEWIEDFDAVVRRAFQRPDRSAFEGWEPLARTRERVVAAVGSIRERCRGEAVVLVGHGTAWTLARAELLGEEPDLAWWSTLAMPDVCEVVPGGQMPGGPRSG